MWRTVSPEIIATDGISRDAIAPASPFRYAPAATPSKRSSSLTYPQIPARIPDSTSPLPAVAIPQSPLSERYTVLPSVIIVVVPFRSRMVPVFFALEPKRDRAVAEQVAAMVDCPHHIVSAPHDGHLIVGMMGAMEAVVSMRLHALIFAAGQGVPLVGVVYDPKVSGFLDYLHQTRYLPLEEVSQARLMPMLEEALAQTGRDDASAMRALAEENEQAARRLLEEFR